MDNEHIASRNTLTTRASRSEGDRAGTVAESTGRLTGFVMSKLTVSVSPAVAAPGPAIRSDLEAAGTSNANRLWKADAGRE